jgi:hypothetical protein
MTRLSVSALIAALLAAVLAVGCGSDGGATTASATVKAHSETVASSRVPRYAYLRMSKCSLPRGGGGHVRVHRLSCKEAQSLVGPLANLNVGQNRRAKELVYRSKNYPQAAGWTCWGGFDPRAGPIRYVCWRKDQVLLFRFS